MTNKAFGKRPGKFYQSIFRHIRIQNLTEAETAPELPPNSSAGYRHPEDSEPRGNHQTPRPQPAHPKPSAPPCPSHHVSAPSGPPHACQTNPTPWYPPCVSPPDTPITADPTRGQHRCQPQVWPYSPAQGSPGRGSRGGARGSPPLPWRQAGARQRSHGCQGRSGPGSRLSWLPALFPLVTTRGPNASPR